MKRIAQVVCTMTIAALLGSCGGGHEYTIDGTVADSQMDGENVYLYRDGQRADSMVISEGGFRFAGQVAEPWLATAVTSRAQVTFVVEAGAVTLDMQQGTMGGTALNERLNAFNAAVANPELEAELATYLKAYYGAPNAELRAEAERKYDSVEAIGTKRTMDLAWELYRNNEHNVLAAYAMSIIISLDEGMTYRTLDSLLRQADPAVGSYAPVARRLEQLRHIEATSAGKRYTDVEGILMETGAAGSLRDLINGRVAVVDFWASWCGPCRNEIRDNLIPLYAKYKDKGLQVVGLNVWERGNDKLGAHAKAVKDLGIEYPQLIDTTRTATETYGVTGIPQILIIGADGTILARDLRGTAIEEAIVNALQQ